MKVEDIMASTIVPSDQASGLSRARCHWPRGPSRPRERSGLYELCRSGKWIDSEIDHENDVVTRSSETTRR